MTTRTAHPPAHSSVSGVFLDTFRFPLWWYTRGVMHFARLFFSPLRFASDYLALPVLAQSLTQPLFGDVTRGGRTISVFVRIGHFLVLLGAIAILGLLLGVVYLFWVLLPVLAVLQILRIGVGLFLP